jgi:hypothetical protein
MLARARRNLAVIQSISEMYTHEKTCIYYKRKFFNTVIYATYILDVRPSIFIGDRPLLPSERMLHKYYGRKGPVAHQIKTLVVSLKGLDAKTN